MTRAAIRERSVQFTVAIDGPAAAGKGTISKVVAKEFGFAYLDTGLLYRAVGAKVIAGADPIKAAQNLQASDLKNPDLRSAAVAKAASPAAAIPEVRQALHDFQTSFARQEGGTVLDGRDIGTVICPKADVKMFITASAERRAERRYKELISRGAETTYASVLEDVKIRDARDASRETAPMVAAKDAVLIDTSDMSIDEAIAAAIAEINAVYKT